MALSTLANRLRTAIIACWTSAARLQTSGLPGGHPPPVQHPGQASRRQATEPKGRRGKYAARTAPLLTWPCFSGGPCSRPEASAQTVTPRLSAPPAGTARWLAAPHQPVVNRLLTRVLRSPLSGAVDGFLVLLAVPGRRTGRAVTLPVQYAAGRDAIWVRPGQPETKTWWRNLPAETAVGLRLRCAVPARVRRYSLGGCGRAGADRSTARCPGQHLPGHRGTWFGSRRGGPAPPPGLLLPAHLPAVVELLDPGRGYRRAREPLPWAARADDRRVHRHRSGRWPRRIDRPAAADGALADSAALVRGLSRPAGRGACGARRAAACWARPAVAGPAQRHARAARRRLVRRPRASPAGQRVRRGNRLARVRLAPAAPAPHPWRRRTDPRHAVGVVAHPDVLDRQRLPRLPGIDEPRLAGGPSRWRGRGRLAVRTRPLQHPCTGAVARVPQHGQCHQGCRGTRPGGRVRHDYRLGGAHPARRPREPAGRPPRPGARASSAAPCSPGPGASWASSPPRS